MAGVDPLADTWTAPPDAAKPAAVDGVHADSEEKALFLEFGMNGCAPGRVRSTKLLGLVALVVSLPTFGACLGPSEPSRPPADKEESPTQEPEPIVLDATNPVPDDVLADSPSGPYVWENLAIHGGGFVTGIVFSPAAPNLIYARTDVGGAYRYDIGTERWIPLTDFIGQENNNLSGIESIAADPTDARRVYLAAGMYVTAGNGAILRSEDFGKNWTRHPISVPMGGNANGRSMGERLSVDPNHPEKLYFGSRTQGLWVSTNFAESWSRLSSFPVTGDQDLGLSFVLFDRESGEPGTETPTAYVGLATLTEAALYRTMDGGQSWEPVPGQPQGLMPHHAVLDSEGLLYLAYNDGPGPNDISRGAIHKFDTNTGNWSDVSPRQRAGFGGISIDAKNPGTLMVSTIALWAPDEIYRSRDAGQTWSALNARSNRDDAGATWLYFGGNSLSATGWMGDIEIDPFNPSRVLHITGQGIWWTDDVTNVDARRTTNFRFHNAGLEETVALDLVSPPSGARLLSAVGDIAGFRHDDFTRSPPAGMFENPVFGNTDSLDFAELEPNIVVRVGTRSGAPRGAYSTDGGSNWTPFAAEPSGSQGSGSVAIAADGSTILWSPQGATVSYSRDSGRTWTASSGAMGSARVAADRVNPLTFYAASRSEFFVSTDGGETFSSTVSGLSRGTRPRPVFGMEGELWLVSGAGLQRSRDFGSTFESVPNIASPLAVGFGHPAPDADYPAVYVSGQVAGVFGIFRSDDAGESFSRIDDDRHRFGWVSHITGDQRQYGRVYLGTGGRGILYGDPVN